MIIEIVTAAILGGLTVKMLPKGFGRRRMAIRQLHFEPGEIIYDIAFEGEWELTGDQIQQLARTIKDGCQFLNGRGAYMSNGSTKLAAEISRRILPLKVAYDAMMATRPADYDPDQDPPEVKQFFRAVREVMIYGH